MGFYDFNCAVTGVSLKGVDAVLVGLREAGGGLRPVTLGIAGHYNRLGSVDGIAEDLNTELVFRYFTDRAADGRFALDPAYADDLGNPPADLEALLNYLERNVSESSEQRPAAALDGRRVFSALVAAPVWAALAMRAATDDPPEALFGRVFEGVPTATGIYGDRICELSRHVRELHAVDSHLRACGRPWAPQPDDEIGAQHYGQEMRGFLESARRDFGEDATIRAALDRYAAAVAHLLRD
ncbi:hypothetical protein [Micromonospora sp. NPDC023633]|uniref:hypothetical protein n=1 Tax=Micromonospora sp. NPDC023633 TaxID=3154320 RepID=UPI0033E53BD6